MVSHKFIVYHSKSQVKCNLCKVFVSNRKKNIKTHVESGPHTDKYLRRLQIQNNIIVWKYKGCNRIECVICDVYFSNYNNIASVQQHIDTTQHKQSMEEIEDAIGGHFMNLPEEGTRQVHCAICKCKVGFTLACISTHTEGCRHRKALAVRVQQDNGIFNYDDTDEELWCKVCDVSISNDVDSILDHVDNDADHAAKLEELEDLVEDEEISIEKYLSEIDTHMAHCQRCGVFVPCNVHNLSEHIEGWRHNPDTSGSASDSDNTI